MKATLLAAGAAVAAAAPALRQLQASATPLPQLQYASGNALFAIPGSAPAVTPATVNAQMSLFTADVAALAYVTADRVAWLDTRVCDNSNPQLQCSNGPVYVTVNITDPVWAPRATYMLGLSYENGAAVTSQFTDFTTAVGAPAAPVLVAVAATGPYNERDMTKYRNDFGAYFGMGVGLCLLLAIWVFRYRLFAPCGLKAPAAPSEFHRTKVVEEEPAAAGAAPMAT